MISLEWNSEVVAKEEDRHELNKMYWEHNNMNEIK